MSEPTLTDEQREGDPLILRTARHIAEKDPFRHIRLGHSSSMTVREFVAEVDEWVAAMLADERAAHEAAEAKVRDLTAGIGALCEQSRKNGWPVPPSDLRALVDDPAAALAEVRAEALRKAADEWSEFETFIAADGERSIRMHGKSPDAWLRDRAEAEGAGR